MRVVPVVGGGGGPGAVSEGCLNSELETSESGLEAEPRPVLAVTSCWKGTTLALLSLKLVRTCVCTYVWGGEYYLHSVGF